jgi:hypothetical protein
VPENAAAGVTSDTNLELTNRPVIAAGVDVLAHNR